METAWKRPPPSGKGQLTCIARPSRPSCVGAGAWRSETCPTSHPVAHGGIQPPAASRAQQTRSAPYVQQVPGHGPGDPHELGFGRQRFALGGSLPALVAFEPRVRHRVGQGGLWCKWRWPCPDGRVLAAPALIAPRLGRPFSALLSTMPNRV
eukprot:6640963-Pyramimonas_sp.AAC.1